MDHKPAKNYKSEFEVISQLIAAQSMLHVFPDDVKLGEFIVQALIGIPGVEGCAICLRNGSCVRDMFEFDITTIIETLKNIPEDQDHFSIDLPEKENRHIFSIQSLERSFGYVFLSIKESGSFEIFSPAINNFINMVAMDLENQWQKQQLVNHKFHLEKLVEKRTVELEEEINERKQVESKLLKNQYYLTKAQEIGIIGTWEFDIQKSILKWTDENYKIFGVPLGTEMNFELFMNCIHPDDRDYVNTKWNAGLNKDPYDIEHRIIINDKVKWVREKAEIEFDTEGKPVMAIGFAQDISDRKQTEMALKETEEKFRTLVTNTEEIVYIIANDGTFLLSEGKGLSKLGLQPGQVIGQSVFELFKDFPDMLDEMRRAFDGETIISEAEVGDNYFRNWYTPRKNHAGEIIGLLGLSVNISEQKKMEEKVIEEKNKAQQYLNIAEVMLVSTDSSGIVKLINPKGCEILGYSEEEIVGHNWFDNFLPERLREIVRQVSKKVFAGEMESVAYYENEILTKAGDERLIAWHNAIYKDDKGNIIGTLSSGEDITERKQAEIEIKIEQDKLTAIFESMQDGAYIVNKDYDIQYVNPVLKKEFGLPGGKKCHKYFHDSDEPCSFCKNEDVYAGKTVQWEWTSPVNGKTYDLIDTPLKNSDGSISKLEIFRDITERKLTEEELAKHREHLEELIKERTKELEEKNVELERFNKLFVGREFRIKELRDRVKELEKMKR